MQLQLTFDHIRVPYKHVCTWCLAIRQFLVVARGSTRYALWRFGLFLDGRTCAFKESPLPDAKTEALRFLREAEKPGALVVVCIEHMRAALQRGGLTLADIHVTEDSISEILRTTHSS